MNYIKFYTNNKQPYLNQTKLCLKLDACILEDFLFNQKIKAIDPKEKLQAIYGTEADVLSRDYTNFMMDYFKDINATSCKDNGIELPTKIEVPDLRKAYNNALAANRPHKLYYFGANHLGSGSLITNESGNTYQTILYAPHGELLYNGFLGTYDEPYKHTGHYFDIEQGTYYAHARYYDPYIVVPYSTEPLFPKYPQYGSYVWCGNSPTMYVDKDGQQFVLPVYPPIVGVEPIAPPLMGVADVVVSSKPVVPRPVVENIAKTNRTPNIERLQAGRQAEVEQLQKFGLEKNTQKITGKDGKSIPDGFEEGQTFENKLLKDGTTQNFTRQLKIQKEVSNTNNKIPRLNINKEAKISKPLEGAGFDITTYSLFPSVMQQDNTKIVVPFRIEPVLIKTDINK